MELQTEHARKVDDQISGVLLFGFVLGIFFSYSGMLGFGTGFVMGVVATRKFPDEAYNRVNRFTETVYNVLTQVQAYLISDLFGKN